MMMSLHLLPNLLLMCNLFLKTSACPSKAALVILLKKGFILHLLLQRLLLEFLMDLDYLLYGNHDQQQCLQHL